MFLPFQLHDTCTRLRATVAVGSYGAEVPDWTAPATVELACEFQPLTVQEDLVQQQRTESQWKVFLYADADVVATDRIRFRGIDYEIDGQPKRWRLRGGEHHLELVVQLVTGG
jgi:hypothetical protein